MKKILWITICILILIFGFILYVTNKTVRINQTDIDGFTPIKNDELAKKFCPIIISNDIFDYPYAVYYRSSIDDQGNVHIAYHYFWYKEENTTKGFVPWLSRNIYTGGLKLQKIMFGKHDIEVIGITIDKNGKILKVIYESPEDYDPYDFSVKHKTQHITEFIEMPLRFKVVSWNHLFEYVKRDYTVAENEKEIHLIPQYFSQKLWEEFTMFKQKETLLKQNRAHFIWEREYVQ